MEIMKLQLLALAILAGSLTVSALAQQKEPPISEQDREQILAIGKTNDEAWSKGDAAALAALYLFTMSFSQLYRLKLVASTDRSSSISSKRLKRECPFLPFQALG
jgi:hypothetical protein